MIRTAVNTTPPSSEKPTINGDAHDHHPAIVGETDDKRSRA
ncbi:hypothetical protein [Cohnella lupini]|nr:hypothetical protein [Cohnella lupini]